VRAAAICSAPREFTLSHCTHDAYNDGGNALKDAAQPAAVVLDAEQKSSLAAIRSLGARGIRVIAGSNRPTAMGLYSRYVDRRFLYPSPLRQRDGFVDCVTSLVHENSDSGPPVLLAFSDSTLLPLAADSRAGEWWKWPLSTGDECFWLAFDKGCTLALAESLGVAIPKTYFQTSADDLPEFLHNCSFPLVVKPRRSVSWYGAVNGGGVQLTRRFAGSLAELKSLCDELVAKTGEFPLIQEYVQGEEASVQYLCDRGSVVAACANRRLRSAHPTGGPGALKETVPLSYHGMAQLARRLVTAVTWSGPIMVEFKIDRASGVPKLMETNGRFWGSLPLAVLAGIDFPYLYYQLALNLDIVRAVDYRLGITSRHFMADLRHLRSALFRADPMRGVAYPSRWRALRDFFRTPENCKSDVVDVLDPLPAAVELVDASHDLFRRLFR